LNATTNQGRVHVVRREFDGGWVEWDGAHLRCTGASFFSGARSPPWTGKAAKGG